MRKALPFRPQMYELIYQHYRLTDDEIQIVVISTGSAQEVINK